MNINVRRLFWVAFYVISLVAVALIAGFFGRNLMGIGPSPTRSAFSGRLPSIPDPSLSDDQRRFQFFYATNRVNNDSTFNERGNELGNEITKGTFDVLISPYLQIMPHVWFDKASLKLSDRTELPHEQFKTQLRQAVEASPKKSILVIVWGFRDWFQSAALKTAFTAYALDINTPVVLFDWPGNQGEGRNGYLASQSVATQSAPDLGRFLAELFRHTGAENIWLMGSSLGCQTICDSFAWLETQPDLIQGKPKLSHVVLSAPDVSAQAFDDKFAERITALAEHLTAYVSSNDRALLMSHWVNRGRRLGRIAEVSVPPEERKEEYEFEEALELLDLQAQGVRNISVVDATPINTVRNLHHFFTDSPVFFDDLYQRLLRPNYILSRRLHEIREPSLKQSYWILWN
ncbi:MAG: alpha/beta hydrolase [Parachlamydiaceae bacterium]|nr:alpha/beta hydrolase [Parachlamydiaceae bacterium]